MGFGHRELIYYFGTIQFGREERNPGTPGEQFQFECCMFSDKFWSNMPSCAVFFWWYVCLHTTKSNHATNKYIYPIFCIWIPIWKVICHSESLWEYTVSVKHQTNQQGWTSLPNRKRPEVLLWLSLMGSFQIVDVASACVHHDMVSKATILILACGNRTSPWTTKPIVFVCISHFQKEDFQCLCQVSVA